MRIQRTVRLDCLQ